MQKPKFNIGQQVVVDFTASQHICKIVSAQIVSGQWSYGVKTKEDAETTSFVTETQIKFWLINGAWTGSSTVRT